MNTNEASLLLMRFKTPIHVAFLIFSSVAIAATVIAGIKLGAPVGFADMLPYGILGIFAWVGWKHFWESVAVLVGAIFLVVIVAITLCDPLLNGTEAPMLFLGLSAWELMILFVVVLPMLLVIRGLRLLHTARAANEHTPGRIKMLTKLHGEK